ncbi:MAG TPA: glycosyltransferase [Geminicoccaceae bacterium]|nr:glycosyltransferase [Geminicoccaceae bacterium]
MDSPARLLIFSHDSFGLGHLRRCRTIAHHLVARFPHLSVLILSGSPIIGSFDFKSRVDFVRVPGVIKLRNGEYTSLQLHIDIEQTLDIRSSIIRHTADIFDPHLFLVDKEPLGLRGEVLDTLQLLKERGARLVLGLRDVMDEPRSLRDEWRRKNVYPALHDLYDDIWVYGLPQIFDVLTELPNMQALAHKLVFTGYLRRSLPSAPPQSHEHELPAEPYILVTTGGGGDGEDLIDWVLRAYESDPGIPYPALLVFGPFMHLERRMAFQDRAARLERVRAITFDARFEGLLLRALGVVAMGGYNTFCEILSFGKPALIVPRTAPRQEQYLRAERAAQLGLVRMLPDDGRRAAAEMAAQLRELPSWPTPDAAAIPGLLDGLPRISDLARRWLEPAPAALSVRA